MTTLAAELQPTFEAHRSELLGYCYRMLGSSFDAEDAVQDTMVRAWRHADGFEGRSAVRSWLYRIATNVCLDMIGSRSKRARPMDLSATGWQPVEASLAARRPEEAWLEPALDTAVLGTADDPAEVVAGRESVRLAFVAALQHLPPRQRAVLVLRDVLRWKADEVADLLATTTASVNSALQRARATLEARGLSDGEAYDPLDPAQAELLQRYCEAFEAYDMDALVQLLHDDATQSMPPYEMWLEGRDDVIRWFTTVGHECEGSRLLPLVANGAPAFAQYRPSGPGGRHEPWAIQVLDVREGRVQGITSFLDTRLFALLGLPQHPDDAPVPTPRTIG